jgi:ribosomal protein S18 acetylase RimI-like enzyme
MITLRHIQDIDIQGAKILADVSRDAVGFITRQKFEEVAKQQRGFVALENSQVVGFVLYRHRKLDQQTTLSEICVHKDYRGQHIGKQLVNALVQECRKKSRQFIQLKCPTDLPANVFYRQLGFELSATEKGKKRSLNIWRLSLSHQENDKV